MIRLRKQTTSLQNPHHWSVILAGGDGTRLLPFTRRINGDDRPKQFSAVLGRETLLDQTRRRVARIIDPSRILYSLTKTHERYFADQVADVAASRLAIQPYNHGTAQAILFALLRLRQLDSQASVAFFPSDHHFSNDRALASQINAAFASAESRPENVVLLGIAADVPEESYGWIEPGEEVDRSTFRVARFWEKPAREVAVRLMRGGCLWNSFVMIGRVDAFLAMVRAALPGLYDAFASRAQELGTEREMDALLEIYRSTEATNFSQAVLERQTDKLTVTPGRNLGWSDLGEPQRVYALMHDSSPLRGAGFQPAAALLGGVFCNDEAQHGHFFNATTPGQSPAAG